jgi:tRNA G18 (ribose-2'-O)-methylase SpoU
LFLRHIGARGVSGEFERREPCSGPIFFLPASVMPSEFVQLRHQPPVKLQRPRELVLACPPMRSNINLSRIVRAASCCGIKRMICCGHARILPEISRETGDSIRIETHRTLPPVLRRLREEGFPIIGLEQASDSQSLFDFPFPRKLVLVVGNERQGIEDEVLRLLDQTIEIPVYGMPFAHNVGTATAMAIYEYCRQYPEG